jgi:hypothetical protein
LEAHQQGFVAPWWFVLLRPALLDPAGLASKRRGQQRWTSGMARVVSDYRDNFVVRLLQHRSRGGHTFDWLGLLPFLALGLTESALVLALGPAGVFWILVSLSLCCPVASVAAAWVAGRYFSALQADGVLTELRQFPLPQTVLETGLLVAPCATGTAGSLIIHGLMIPTAVYAMAGISPGFIIAGILPLAWGALRFGVMSAAIRYGIFVGWSSSIEAMRRDEAPGSAVGDWFDRQWRPLGVWFLAAATLALMIASPVTWLRLGGLFLGLVLIFPVPINYWFGCAAEADRIVQGNSGPNALGSLRD